MTYPSCAKLTTSAMPSALGIGVAFLFRVFKQITRVKKKKANGQTHEKCKQHARWNCGA